MATGKLAFVGLGVMGYPMAGHLARAGHEVTVCDSSPEKSARWVTEHGGRAASTPAQAAAGAEVVLMCVGNDNDVRQVAFGTDGALAAMSEGATLVDHTTASAEVARELHAAAKARRLGFVDAPMSGGQAGAEGGKLTIMVGGDPDVHARVAPVLAHYAHAVTLMGGPGCGQLTKMVNQISVVAVVQGLAEGIHFAQRAGLDAERVIDAISKGAATSWQMENRSKTMIADRYDFGFAVDWMRKDLGICLDEARRNGANLPVTAIIDQFLARVQQQGGGRLDTSSLLRALRGTP